jgi:hypothetical protein
MPADDETDRGSTKDDPGAGTRTEGGEGAENAEATPPISEEGEHGQTQTPAPEEDAGSKDG